MHIYDTEETLKSPSDVLLYLVNQTLITVSALSKKKSSKTELKRQIQIAQDGIDWIRKFNVDSPDLRISKKYVAEVNNYGGNVLQWCGRVDLFPLGKASKNWVTPVYSIAEAISYITDCTLATVSDLASKKVIAQGALHRQISIAGVAILCMAEFGIDGSKTRVDDVKKHGNVEMWAETFKIQNRSANNRDKKQV